VGAVGTCGGAGDSGHLGRPGRPHTRHASRTSRCLGQRKSGMTRRPRQTSGMLTSGWGRPPRNSRSSTRSSSSLRIGAGPVAIRWASFLAPPMAVRSSEHVGDLAHARAMLGLRLTNRAPERLRRGSRRDVQTGPRWGSHRDALMSRHVTRIESACAMNVQALLRAASIAGNDHLCGSRPPAQEPPQRGRCEVAQHRAFPTGQHSRHEVSVKRPRLVTNRVNPTVHPVKLPAPFPQTDRLGALNPHTLRKQRSWAHPHHPGVTELHASATTQARPLQQLSAPGGVRPAAAPPALRRAPAPAAARPTRLRAARSPAAR